MQTISSLFKVELGNSTFGVTLKGFICEPEPARLPDQVRHAHGELQTNATTNWWKYRPLNYDIADSHRTSIPAPFSVKSHDRSKEDFVIEDELSMPL